MSKCVEIKLFLASAAACLSHKLSFRVAFLVAFTIALKTLGQSVATQRRRPRVYLQLSALFLFIFYLLQPSRITH